MNTHPEHGVRVRFELRQATDERALYRVTLFSGDQAIEVDAELRLADGAVEIGGIPPTAPDNLVRSVTPFAKQILSGRRADPAAQWPRRVLRWRAERPSN
jgi:hypothetical protein